MSLSLKLTVIIFALVLFLIVFRLLNKKTIPIKYALVWFFSVIMIITIITIMEPLKFFQIKEMLKYEKIAKNTSQHCILIENTKNQSLGLHDHKNILK